MSGRDESLEKLANAFADVRILLVIADACARVSVSAFEREPVAEDEEGRRRREHLGHLVRAMAREAAEALAAADEFAEALAELRRGG